jgi:integrase
MTRFVDRLSLEMVKDAPKGMHADGGGLYLHVNGKGAKSWIFRYMMQGKAYEMGLGSHHTVDLHEARRRALARRLDVLDGKNPIEDRRLAQRQAELERAKTTTFADCARQYITAHRAGWRSPKSLAAWEGTLASFVYPIFGNVQVGAVDVALVTKALRPIWDTKPETANRVRGRIEAILDFATVHHWREGDNPARWRGNLDKTLPNKTKVRAVEHHPALAFGELPAFVEVLRQENGTAAQALEFAILTSARTGEVIGAQRREIDLTARLWTIPGSRMKGGREHRVPLSDAALAVIAAVPLAEPDAFLFPGGKPRRPLSNMAMLQLLKRMKRDDLTVHGFRSTFRDWAAERTGFQNEVIEMALAHAVGDKVEAAYRRGDLFDKRRRLMDAWAGYCTSAPAIGGVVPLRRA